MIGRVGRLAYFGALSALVLNALGCVRRGNYECRQSDECMLNGVAGACEAIGYCSFPDDGCPDGRRFGEYSGRYANQCVSAITPDDDGGIDAPDPIDVLMADSGMFTAPCPIPSNALHAWSLDIPLNAEWNVQADVPYSADNRGALASTAFSRIGYCFELDTLWVYTEMNDFTGGTVANTGIPTDIVYKVAAASLTVRTNSPAVTEVTSSTSGLLELWSNCYSAGQGNAKYDYNDVVSTAVDCYGSFQVFENQTTVFAYNRWSEPTNNDDVGIGNAPAGEPDWTFAQNAGTKTSRRLQAVIIP